MFFIGLPVWQTSREMIVISPFFSRVRKMETCLSPAKYWFCARIFIWFQGVVEMHGFY